MNEWGVALFEILYWITVTVAAVLVLVALGWALFAVGCWKIMNRIEKKYNTKERY